ncbi:MAG: (2Fe-2S) ferredoxin domain-containing protein [Pseudomonadota bacterium]
MPTRLPKKLKVLFCINDRGENKRSCAASGADALRRYAKAEVGEDKGIKVKKAGCLGLCKHGPVIQVLPSKLYYQCTTEAEVDLLLAEYCNLEDAGTAKNGGTARLISTGKAAKKSKHGKGD